MSSDIILTIVSIVTSPLLAIDAIDAIISIY